MGTNSDALLDNIFKLSILTTIVVLALYFGGSLIFPILFAIFFSLALLGPARWLERLGLARAVTSVFLVTAATALIFGILMFISLEGFNLVETINIDADAKSVPVFEQVGNWIQSNSSLDMKDSEKAINSSTQKIISLSGSLIQQGANALRATIVFLSLVPIYTFLMLVYRSRWKQFLQDFLSKRGSKVGVKMIEDTARMIQSYIAGLLGVVLVVAVLYGVGLHLIGVPFATFLALITAILIIIPYIGAFLGATLPTIIALITMDSPWYALVVLGLYVLVQVIEGYILTPLIVGRSVDLNPLVIIIGMLFFGAIGGLLGLLLAVPLIATGKIIFSHIQSTRPLADLMEQKS